MFFGSGRRIRRKSSAKNGRWSLRCSQPCVNTAFICLISSRPILLSPNVPAECFRESEETGLAVVYAEAAPYPVLVLASRDGLGRFYFFSVFAEPGFAVAPRASYSAKWPLRLPALKLAADNLFPKAPCSVSAASLLVQRGPQPEHGKR